MNAQAGPRWKVPDRLWSDYQRNYDRIAKVHLWHFNQFDENPWIPENKWVQWEDQTAALIARFAPDGPILDCGVGQGRLLSRFPDRERHGIDIASAYLGATCEKGIDAIHGRFEDLPYDDDRFAAVVATDILEHVLDLNRCVSEALRVLRPGGHLFVRTPDAEDLTQYVAGPFKFIHLRSFTEPTFRILFETVFGCKVVAVAKIDIEINVVVKKPTT